MAVFLGSSEDEPKSKNYDVLPLLHPKETNFHSLEHIFQRYVLPPIFSLDRSDRPLLQLSKPPQQVILRFLAIGPDHFSGGGSTVISPI